MILSKVVAPVHPEVMRQMERSLAVFQAAGAEIIPIPIPDSFKICNDLAIIISGSESSSAHSNWLKERAEDYGSQTRERLLTGFLVSAVDYLDALKFREKILEEFLCDVFDKVDLLHSKVFIKLARRHDIVFATSFGYMDPMVKAASKYPDTIFMHATGYKGNDKNMDNYVCHSFQARYLTGIAAGMLTKNGKIGVVGSHPIPEIIRNINAIALGAQTV